jgi:hypothetical protein
MQLRVDAAPGTGTGAGCNLSNLQLLVCLARNHTSWCTTMAGAQPYVLPLRWLLATDSYNSTSSCYMGCSATQQAWPCNLEHCPMCMHTTVDTTMLPCAAQLSKHTRLHLCCLITACSWAS